MPYVKLDCGILDSTIWLHDAETRVCWITLLAMADAGGMIEATAPGIAHRACLSIEATRKALSIFESTDPDSKTGDGRRIERVEGGYLVINYDKYRHKDHTAAERKRRQRAAAKNQQDADVSRGTSVTNQECHAKAYTEAKNTLSSEPKSGSSEFELTPPKTNGEADPRFKPAVDAIKAYWDLKNPGRPFVFGSPDGKQLKNFLRDCRQLTIEQFQYCLQQRAQSQVVHSDRPCKWISDLMSYANGPLDKFKKPLETK